MPGFGLSLGTASSASIASALSNRWISTSFASISAVSASYCVRSSAVIVPARSFSSRGLAFSHSVPRSWRSSKLFRIFSSPKLFGLVFCRAIRRRRRTPYFFRGRARAARKRNCLFKLAEAPLEAFDHGLAIRIGEILTATVIAVVVLAILFSAHGALAVFAGPTVASAHLGRVTVAGANCAQRVFPFFIGHLDSVRFGRADNPVPHGGLLRCRDPLGLVESGQGVADMRFGLFDVSREMDRQLPGRRVFLVSDVSEALSRQLGAIYLLCFCVAEIRNVRANL